MVSFFLVQVFFCQASEITSAKYHLMQYTDERGLPQNSVQDFAFGNYGFVWIATEGGLARFDGRLMRVYKKEELRTRSDRYVAAGFDLGAAMGTLTAVNEYGQRIIIEKGDAFLDQRSRTPENEELRQMKLQTLGRKIDFDTTIGADHTPKYRILAGRGGRLYLYVSGKVVFFEKGRLSGEIAFKGTPYFKSFPPEMAYRAKMIQETKGRICVDNFMCVDGTLFYHQESEGTVLLRVSQTGVVPMILTGEIERDPAFGAKRSGIRIFVNRFKGQTFAYLNGNIYQITYEEGLGQLHTKLLFEDLNLEEKMVHRVLYDEGNRTLFLGSISQGLFVIRPKLFEVTGTDTPEGYNSFFYAQVSDSDSSVLTSEGLEISRSGGSRRWSGFPRPREGLFRYSMLRDQEGGIWGIGFRKFYRIVKGSREQKEWRTGRLQPQCLYQGMDRRIWISFRGGGLAYLPSSDSKSAQPQIVGRVKGNCTFLYQDKSDRLWIGTSSGLYKYDLGKSSIAAVPGLTTQNIRSIMHTKPDHLWITTYGDGIYLLRGNRLHKMPLDNKGYLAYAHCILKDTSGFFWISTNKGIVRTSERDMRDFASEQIANVLYLYYNKNDGFLTNEFNGGCQPCGVKLANGYFSFPSMNGLVWFKPNHFQLPDLRAPIRLEDFELDEKKMEAADTLHLPYNFNHFSFLALSAFMGGERENVNFYFAIRKSPDNALQWSPIDNGQRIDIYRMEAGTYTVELKQVVGFGGRNMNKKITLIVGAPWFLNWKFILTVIIVLCAVVWLITKWRVRSLILQNALLAGKVSERTVDLSRALEELKASDQALQMQLQVQMRIIGAINHDLHTPLQALSVHISRYLSQVASQPDHPETIQLGQSIEKSTWKVFHLADELLDFIRVTYNKNGAISYETVYLYTVLCKKIQFFREFARENKCEIDLVCEPDTAVRSNRIMLEILIHNLIDNALKHTYNHPVRIVALAGSEGVKVTISDAGLGMADEMVAWLNSGVGDIQKSVMQAPPPNLGLGLIMVSEIAMLLGIRLSAVSSNEGTAVSVILVNQGCIVNKGAGV